MVRLGTIYGGDRCHLSIFLHFISCPYVPSISLDGCFSISVLFYKHTSCGTRQGPSAVVNVHQGQELQDARGQVTLMVQGRVDLGGKSRVVLFDI